jgi:hypothetical protein
MDTAKRGTATAASDWNELLATYEQKNEQEYDWTIFTHQVTNMVSCT